MVVVIGFVKDCFKEERNNLFSAHLVNSTKRNKIKSQQKKFKLDTKGDFLMVYLRLLPSGTPGQRCFKNRADRCLPKGI